MLDAQVYLGGPVQPDRGFVLHTAGEGFDSTLSITPEISVTTSRDVLEAIADGKGPDRKLDRPGLRRLGRRSARGGDERQRLAQRTGGRGDHLRSAGGCALAGRRPPAGRGPEPAERRGRTRLNEHPARFRLRPAQDRRRRRPDGDRLGLAADDAAQPRRQAGLGRHRAPDREWQPEAVVVGLPYNMDDTEAEMRRAQRFARQLHGRFGLAVHLVDERLTSLEARRQLGRNATSLEVVDAMAAKLILETWLVSTLTSGNTARPPRVDAQPCHPERMWRRVWPTSMLEA